MFCKIGVLRNFAKFTGKRLCQSLFSNKVTGLRPLASNFIKKEALAQVLSCEIYEKFLIKPFLTEHLRWLFLTISRNINKQGQKVDSASTVMHK